MTTPLVKPDPTPIEEAHAEQLADVLEAVDWSNVLFSDGKPRRRFQLAKALVRRGVRCIDYMAIPDWQFIAQTMTVADPTLMISLELLKDQDNRIARALRQAFAHGMAYAGVTPEEAA